MPPKLGIDTEVLDIHDGELMPTWRRRRIASLIREWQADIVLSHRPNDYHPDHRYVGVLVQDASFHGDGAVLRPGRAAHAAAIPIFLFYSDAFLKPYPFDPILAVGFDEVAQKKWDCISSLPSQFGDADSWQARTRPNVPTDEAGRKAFLIDMVKQRSADVANQYRDLLVKLYGEQKGRAIKYAEAFELNQYGSAGDGGRAGKGVSDVQMSAMASASVRLLTVETPTHGRGARRGLRRSVEPAAPRRLSRLRAERRRHPVRGAADPRRVRLAGRRGAGTASLLRSRPAEDRGQLDDPRRSRARDCRQRGVRRSRDRRPPGSLHGPQSLVFLGFSQGTAMAYRAALLGAHRPNGVIALGGDIPPELTTGDRRDWPAVLIGAGADDEWVPHRTNSTPTSRSSHGPASVTTSPASPVDTSGPTRSATPRQCGWPRASDFGSGSARQKLDSAAKDVPLARNPRRGAGGGSRSWARCLTSG